MLLSTTEETQVAAKVAEVERATAGELVVAVARRSSDYAAPRALFAGAVGVSGALLLHHALPWTGPMWLLLGQLPVGLAFYGLSGMSWLLRLLVPTHLRIAEVEARASQLFVHRGLANTIDRSGVLIYISEQERRVHILADSGIHQRVGDSEWPDNVALIVDGIKKGTPAQGILAAIERIGSQLAREFPPRADDRNELPDEVVRS
jgi:putative membrane protein